LFQQLEIEMVSPRGRGGEAAAGVVMRLYGTMQCGRSVSLSCHGFQPYFYVEIPPAWHGAEGDLAHYVKGKMSGKRQLVGSDVVDRRSLMGYHPRPGRYLRLRFNTPEAHSLAQQALHLSVSLPGKSPLVPALFEANVDHVLRFMTDNEVGGGCWIRIPQGKFTQRCLHPPPLHGVDYKNQFAPKQGQGGQRDTYCGVECDARIEVFEALPCDGEWARLAPLVLASIDIECVSPAGGFPVAEKEGDAIIQIATTVHVVGRDVPHHQSIFILGGCAPIQGCDVRCFATEPELLDAWRGYIVEQIDPDLILGYNHIGFDLPYILARAQMFSEAAPHAGMLGRVVGKAATGKAGKGWGKEGSAAVSGRCLVDIYRAIQKEHNLRSYSLGAVSEEFLGDHKEDVPYAAILPLHQGTDVDRARIAVYCLKDSFLPWRLAMRLDMLPNMIEMARVTGIGLSQHLGRGQQYKVWSQLCRQARKDGFVVPTHTKPNAGGAGGGEKKEGDAAGEEGGYEGATVIDALPGAYFEPIVTLDFASLYPSIIIAHNLSFETMIQPDKKSFGPPPPGFETQQARIKTLRAKGLTVSEFPLGKEVNGAQTAFVQGERGLLPTILINLLACRKKAKKEMAEATDPAVKSILNGKQLALKVSCNSIYGFCGAVNSFLPCIPLAATVTSIGRELIFQTKATVETEFSKSTGRVPVDAKVIYGDTDSVMIRFGIPGHEPDAVAIAMRIGLQCAELVSARFPDPVQLEFEKVYHPYLLFYL